MKSLFKALWAFLKSIFGGGKKEEEGKDKKDDIKQFPGQGTLNPPTQWHLIRFHIGQIDTLGKLYHKNEFICYTLESTTDRANLGIYELGLRTKGGLHATYGFRFKDIHVGVLQILTEDEQVFRFVRTGNLAADGQGGLLLGKEIQNQSQVDGIRELWHSEDAYQEVYPKIANRIANSEKMTLKITLDRQG